MSAPPLRPLLTAITLALLAASCAPPLATQAAARWERATGLVLPADVTVDELYTRHVECGPVHGAVGCTRGHAVTVAVRGQDDADVLVVLLHEFGHVFGATHDDRGVLVPSRDSGGWRPCLTDDDVDAVCDVAGAECTRRNAECRQ